MLQENSKCQNLSRWRVYECSELYKKANKAENENHQVFFSKCISPFSFSSVNANQSQGHMFTSLEAVLKQFIEVSLEIGEVFF